MEPVISTVLQALAVGAQAAATGIATDEIKHTYDKLKTLIQQKWMGKPTAEKLLTAYENNSESNRGMLAEKLEESGIHQDQNIHRQAERLIQEVKIANSTVAVDNSRQEVLNLDRDNSPGNSYTATHGGTLDSSSRRADSGGIINEGQFHQVNNRQTRLAVLLGLLALALIGVVFYLVKTEKIKLPPILIPHNETLPRPSPSSSSSLQLPTTSPEPAKSEQGGYVSDIDNNISLTPRNGVSPYFEGTVTNVGKAEVQEFFVVAIISRMVIDPAELYGVKLVAKINRVRNLKPGETRQVGGYFNLPDAWVEEKPESYKAKDFTYKVDWSENYTWEVMLMGKKTIDTCYENRSCAQKW